jgi:hypothetical protein
VSWFVEDRLTLSEAGRVRVRGEAAGPAGWTVPPVEA